MHTGAMRETDGMFNAERVVVRACVKCLQQTEQKRQTWDSQCDGYTDYKFTCLTCGAVHWVEGCDS